jgi:hypothetical protein
MTNKKELWIALLLNFFIPGVGHIYAGKQSPGVPLLIASVICVILSAFVLPLFALLGIWIYALATTRQAVEECNRQVDADEAKATADAANHITPEAFGRQLSKAHQLFTAGIIDAAEFSAKKCSCIQDLQFKTLKGDVDDVLLAIAPMKQANVLSDEEVAAIKKALILKGG